MRSSDVPRGTKTESMTPHYVRRMILAEHRRPSPIGTEDKLFGIMRQSSSSFMTRTRGFSARHKCSPARLLGRAAWLGDAKWLQAAGGQSRGRRMALSRYRRRRSAVLLGLPLRSPCGGPRRRPPKCRSCRSVRRGFVHRARKSWLCSVARVASIVVTLRSVLGVVQWALYVVADWGKIAQAIVPYRDISPAPPNRRRI